MPRYSEKRIRKKTHEKWLITGPMDLRLFFAVLFLNIYGIIMIYSSTYARYGTYYMRTQIIFVMIGLAAMVGLSYVNYQLIVKLGPIALLLSFAVVLLLTTGFAASGNGATRAIKITSRFSVQPAEAIKLGIIVFFGYYVKKIGVDHAGKRFYLLFFSGLLAFLVWRIANNLSTGIIILGIGYVILLLSTPKPRRYIAFAAAGLFIVVSFAFLYTLMVPYEPGLEEDFRLTRIRAWLDPISFVASEGMQASQALYALGAGGFWGKGLGHSLIKYTLPEARNDFILAVLFEELGVFGVLLLMFLFTYLLYRFYVVIMEAPDISGKVIAIGVFTHFTLQIVLNIMVVVSLFPTTGVSLPFISAGGSSVLFLMVELGIVMNIDKSARELQYREEAEAYVTMREERKRNQRGGASPIPDLTGRGQRSRARQPGD